MNLFVSGGLHSYICMSSMFRKLSRLWWISQSVFPLALFAPFCRFVCVFVLVWAVAAPQEKHLLPSAAVLLAACVLAQSRTLRFTYLLSYAAAKRWVDFGRRPGRVKRHLAHICQRTRGSACARVLWERLTDCTVAARGNLLILMGTLRHRSLWRWSSDMLMKYQNLNF